MAARRAHNPKVAGSNPAPATKTGTDQCLFCFKLYGNRIGTYDPNLPSLTRWILSANELFLSIIFFGKLSIECRNVLLCTGDGDKVSEPDFQSIVGSY